MVMFSIRLDKVNLVHVLLGVVLVFWIFRELRWSSYSSTLLADLTELKEVKENLLYLIKVNEETQLNCNAEYDDNPKFLSDSDAAILSRIRTGKEALAPARSGLYDWLGLSLIVGLASLICFENYWIHDVNHKDDEEEAQQSAVHKQIIRKVNEFVIKKHPITTTVLATLLLVLCPFGWLGIWSRDHFIQFSFKLVLSFSSASLLFFFGHNLNHLRHYFPTDAEGWQNSLRDWHWWLWLCSRMLDIHDITSGTSVLLWLFSLLYYVWPFRYFYYYQHISCSGGNAAATEAVRVFLVNMMGHSTCLMALCFLIYLLVIIPALPPSVLNRNKQDKKGEERSKDEQLQDKYDNVFMRLWSRFQLYSEQSNVVPLLSVLCVANSLLAVIRVGWFVFFTSPCGFYAACVAWMFTHAHIGMILFTLPVVNSLIQRNSVLLTHKGLFVQKFVDEKLKQDSAAAAPGAEQQQGEQEARTVSSELFDNVLFLSGMYYIFVHPYVDKENKSSSNSGEESKEMRLVDIFNSMLQTELFAYNAAAEQEEREGNMSGGENDSAAAAKDEEEEPLDSMDIHD